MVVYLRFNIVECIREAMGKDLWDKLGTLYQYKSLVNKLFLRKKFCSLRMKDGDLVAEHLNAFNIVISVGFKGYRPRFRLSMLPTRPSFTRPFDNNLLGILQSHLRQYWGIL